MHPNECFNSSGIFCYGMTPSNPFVSHKENFRTSNVNNA